MRLIEGKVAADDRGTVKFVNDFNFEGVKRFYQVENHRRGFIRAWHCHEREGKYVYVVTGAALVGVVEYKQLDGGVMEGSVPQRFVLCEELPKVLWIPPGHGNGFMSLRDNTKIIFFSTSSLEETKGDDIRLPYDTWNIWQEDYR